MLRFSRDTFEIVFWFGNNFCRCYRERLGEFAFPIARLGADSAMTCPESVLVKAQKRLELSLWIRGKQLFMKLPKRPPRFDYARFSEQQREVTDEYYFKVLINRLVQAEEAISRSKFFSVVGLSKQIDPLALPQKYSMVLQVKLSNGIHKGFLTVPNDCTLGDLEAFVADSFAKRLGYDIDDGHAYFDIEDNTKEVKGAYNYWLQRMDPSRPQESLSSHYTARLSFAISGYQQREEDLGLGRRDSPDTVMYGGRKKYDERPKGSLQKVLERLNSGETSPEYWGIASSAVPGLTVYADPAVCDVFPKLCETFQKPATQIARGMGCFSFDSLEVSKASYALSWRSSDISVDLRFVAVEQRFKSDTDYPQVSWKKMSQYSTGTLHRV